MLLFLLHWHCPALVQPTCHTPRPSPTPAAPCRGPVKDFELAQKHVLQQGKGCQDQDLELVQDLDLAKDQNLAQNQRLIQGQDQEPYIFKSTQNGILSEMGVCGLI